MFLKIEVPDGDSCKGCRFLSYRGMLVGGLYFCSYFNSFVLNNKRPTDSIDLCFKIEVCLNSLIK